MPVVPRFRLGLDELVHVVADVDHQDNGHTYWTPMCATREAWIVLIASDVEGPPTCLTCVIHPYR